MTNISQGTVLTTFTGDVTSGSPYIMNLSISISDISSILSTYSSCVISNASALPSTTFLTTAANGGSFPTSGASVVNVVDGVNTITIFKDNGTFSPTSSVTVDYLVVAGGGGGGSIRGGGGGAGGLKTGSTTLSVQTYTITVGSGGLGGTGGTSYTSGFNGNPSSIGSVITTEGGGGGGTNAVAGGIGGSGGGGGYGATFGTGTAGQGNNGGSGGGTLNAGGGGGGAGAVGLNATSPNTSGKGGDGVITTLISTAIASANIVGQVSNGNVYFAGGGGGGSYSGTGGSGGIGGGGTGGSSAIGTAGTANTGGGGGAGGHNGTLNTFNGAAGGSGIVILKYPSQNMAVMNRNATATGTFTFTVYLPSISRLDQDFEKVARSSTTNRNLGWG